MPLPISVTYADPSHHSRAFWNIFSQGEAWPGMAALISSGIHPHCQLRKVRSGWGMMARCLPSREQRLAIPRTEPFGLAG